MSLWKWWIYQKTSPCECVCECFAAGEIEPGSDSVWSLNEHCILWKEEQSPEKPTNAESFRVTPSRSGCELSLSSISPVYYSRIWAVTSGSLNSIPEHLLHSRTADPPKWITTKFIHISRPQIHFISCQVTGCFWGSVMPRCYGGFPTKASPRYNNRPKKYKSSCSVTIFRRARSFAHYLPFCQSII